MTTTIDPRSVRLTVHNRSEGEPYTITLTHKPTGKYATGQGRTYEDARAGAERDLELTLAGTPNPNPGFIH